MYAKNINEFLQSNPIYRALLLFLLFAKAVYQKIVRDSIEDDKEQRRKVQIKRTFLILGISGSYSGIPNTFLICCREAGIQYRHRKLPVLCDLRKDSLNLRQRSFLSPMQKLSKCSFVRNLVFSQQLLDGYYIIIIM